MSFAKLHSQSITNVTNRSNANWEASFGYSAGSLIVPLEGL